MLKLLLLMFSLLSFFAESSFAKTDFLKACELDSKSKLKLSLVKSLKEHGVALYLPFERDGQLLMRRTQDQVAKTFGFPPPSILIKSTSELRFLPYTMPGSHVLLITASDRVLDQERISRIADISKLNDFNRHVDLHPTLLPCDNCSHDHNHFHCKFTLF